MPDYKFMIQLENILMRSFNPMFWDTEMHDAWHKELPDINKALIAIGNIAIKRINEIKQ